MKKRISMRLIRRIRKEIKYYRVAFNMSREAYFYKFTRRKPIGAEKSYKVFNEEEV